MKKSLIPLLPLLFLLLPLTASASTQILFGGGEVGQADGTSVTYLPPSALVNIGLNTIVATSTQAIAPISGTLSNLYVTTTINPTGTFTFTVVDNSNNTSITCTITTSSKNCSDTTHTATIHAGDSFSVKVSRSIGSAYDPKYSLAFTPTTANQTMMLGSTAQSLLSTSVTDYMNWAGYTGLSTSLAGGQNFLADSGTINDFYAAATTTTTTGSYAFTVLGGASETASALTCSIGTTANYCDDLSDSTTTVAGSTLSAIASVPSSPSPLAAIFGADFVPNTPGNFDIFTVPYYVTAAEYVAIPSAPAGAGVSATEASTSVPAQPMVVTALYVHSNSQAGTSASRTITLDDNGVATAITCTLSGASARSCSITGQSVTIKQGDKIDYNITQSGSPSPNGMYLGLTLSAHVPTSVRVNYPTTSAKNRLWSGFLRILGGSLKIK